MGYTSEFLLTFIDELKKQIIIRKIVEQNTFDNYHVDFLKKKSEENHYQSLDDMIYSS